MFFWLMAIPFFVIIAMFTLFKLPANDLKKPEEIQDTAMAFRMVLQHDAAAKLMEAYRADAESTLFDLGSYNMEGDGWKAMLEGSKYLPANFISDTDNIVTYIRCLNGLREVANCRKATEIYMITAAAVPSSDAQTSRWFETVGAEDLAEQLGKYAGSFPIRQNGYSLPKKPRQEEGESDAAYAVRLNAYKAEKKDYAKLKRRYYDFGDKLPRPDTTVGQVRAYPFDEGEEANERVIVRRIRSAQGNTVNYETVKVPVDIPDADGQTFDFNGEAIILTESGLCKEGPCACTKGTDCGEGVYCLSGTCSADCGMYGFDANRTCYTTCISDSQCPEGYSCKDGVCKEPSECLTSNDCALGYYCNEGTCTQASFACDSTDFMESETWIQQWSACSRCPAGTFKKYMSWGDTGGVGDGNWAYPVPHPAGCVNIPELNSYTVMPTGIYWVADMDNIHEYTTLSDAHLWHRRVNITCNDKNEEWDLVGPFVEWWEAQEICGKLGKKVPVDSDYLTGRNCHEGASWMARWSLIKNATAVGTSKTLEDASGIADHNVYGGSSDVARTVHYVYTNMTGTGESMYFVRLAFGDAVDFPRNLANYVNFTLCGPAQ